MSPSSAPKILWNLLYSQNHSCKHSSKSRSATALRSSAIAELLGSEMCPKHPAKPQRAQRMLHTSQWGLWSLQCLLFGPSVYCGGKAHRAATTEIEILYLPRFYSSGLLQCKIWDVWKQLISWQYEDLDSLIKSALIEWSCNEFWAGRWVIWGGQQTGLEAGLAAVSPALLENSWENLLSKSVQHRAFLIHWAPPLLPHCSDSEGDDSYLSVSLKMTKWGKWGLMKVVQC